MSYIIAGTATFSSQANRDAALSRVNTALSGYAYTSVATTVSAGGIQTPTTTTITVSIYVPAEVDPGTFSKLIYDAWTASNRHTSGWLSVNDV